MSSRWQLLDRSEEREKIHSALSGDDRRGVVLIGPAGVGKTTLARTVTAAMSTPVQWAACTESSRSIPLGAFAQWVQSSAARDPIALIGSARDSLLAQDDTIVGIDDAHLLDQLSATLLHQIAVEQTGRIVATVRSGEPVPDAVTSLWKDGYLERLDVQPFTKVQCISLIEKVLGGTLEGLSADVMWTSSSGNPLFVRHMVEGALEAKKLKVVDGVWQLRGATVISSGLAALLEARLEHAGEGIDALRLLALSEPLDLDILCQLAGEDSVDAAEMQGLIRMDHDGSRLNARFSHPLFGDVVRRRIGTATARKLRGQIVKVLRERDLDSAGSRIRLAELYADSDQAADSSFLVSAAKDAVFLANLPLGERLARMAFERDGDLRAAELLSRTLLWQGRAAEADDILTNFDPAELDEMQVVLWGLPRLSILFWSMGDVERAHQLLTLLEQRVTHPMLRSVIDAVGSAMLVHENRIDDGLAAARAVLSNPDAPGQAIDFAAFGSGLALPVAGRGSEFEAIAARCNSELKSTDGMIRFMIRYGVVLSLVYTGELDAADDEVAQCARFSSSGQFVGWAITKIMAGCVATYRGRFPDAVSSLEQALAALNAENSMPWRLVARLLLVRAYAALGQTENAERVLADANEHIGPHMALHDPHAGIAKAWLAAARGGERTAVDFARAAANAAHRSGQHAVEAEALHHAARFGDRSVAGRLAALVKKVDGGVVNLQSRHAAAVAASDVDALDAVSHDFEQAGYLLSAADAAAQAAPLHDRAGDRQASAESITRAVHLAGACGGASTPAIRTAVRPLPLSPREREVATMVAAGLSNREIADRMSVAVRTVEGHVYRACIKLGVSDREALAVVIRQELGPGAS
ncbi:MAG: LuxR C-terminal-related transcriptional regulator [Mycobacterium sp.]